VGVVVALCTGHRCAALTRERGDGGLAAAVARSSGGVLISSPCLQQCAEGTVGAVALRTGVSDTTGPSVWLGGLDVPGRLEALGQWVEGAPAAAGWDLPTELRSVILGVGPPVRLTPVER